MCHLIRELYGARRRDGGEGVHRVSGLRRHALEHPNVGWIWDRCRKGTVRESCTVSKMSRLGKTLQTCAGDPAAREDGSRLVEAAYSLCEQGRQCLEKAGNSKASKASKARKNKYSKEADKHEKI
jgi:hypothetical protein